MAANRMNILTYFDGEVIAASGSATSRDIDLSHMSPSGYFGLQYTISGSGTLTLEYEVSVDGETFVTPDDATEIATGLTSGNGYLSFSPEPCAYIRIKATETGTSASATLTLKGVIQ